MIHQPNAAGPALWMTAALVMKRTIDTKIATMSVVLRTRGSIPPATRSAMDSFGCSVPVVAISWSSPDAQIERRTGHSRVQYRSAAEQFVEFGLEAVG